MIKKITLFLSTSKGQNYIHIIYSVAAAVVILGALFKLTHLPAANFILYLGLGTEVLVFLLSAFDIPNKIGCEETTNDKIFDKGIQKDNINIDSVRSMIIYTINKYTASYEETKKMRDEVDLLLTLIDNSIELNKQALTLVDKYEAATSAQERLTILQEIVNILKPNTK